jgi:bifunctional oligoribonuclease and PAP phosphatase NrnA
MTIDWTPLSELISRFDRFLVTTHVRPDGDALGSEVGLTELLRQKGKDVRIVNSSLTPPRYDYLDPDGSRFEHFGSDVQSDELRDRQVLVILDLSSWGQLGDMADFVRQFSGPRLVIDHHVSQDDLGATFLKDTTAEATGTLVLQAARALNATLSAPMAAGLLTAIAMDTGWFRHPTTSPRTLRDVAELVEAGARADEIYKLLFERNTLGRLKMMGETLASLQTDLDGRIAYAAVTREDFERTGAIPPDTEDLVDFTVSLRGVEVGLLFIEQKRSGIKLSVRTRVDSFDCSKLTAQFGGGGHRAAAGATLPDPLSESVSRVLSAVKFALTA